MGYERVGIKIKFLTFSHKGVNLSFKLGLVDNIVFRLFVILLSNHLFSKSNNHAFRNVSSTHISLNISLNDSHKDHQNHQFHFCEIGLIKIDKTMI